MPRHPWTLDPKDWPEPGQPAPRLTHDERRLLWIGLAAIRSQNQVLRERGELTVGDLAIEQQYQDWCDREEPKGDR